MSQIRHLRAAAVGALFTAALTAGSATAAPLAAEPTSSPSPTTAPMTGVEPQCNDPVFMAYYRTWRDVAMPSNANSDLPDPNVIAITDLPYGVDIVSLFHYVDPSKGIDQTPFWDKVKNTYVPELHERGTKVIRSVGVDEIFKSEYGLTATSTDAEFDAAAKKMIAKFVTETGIDGFDIDMETNLSADQQVILGRTFKALSAYLGPRSGTGKLLIYDTNRDAERAYISQVAPYIDYLFAQTYGRSTDSIAKTWDSYAPYISSCQFLPGYTSPEEQDRVNRWYDTVGPVWDSNAIAMAKWQPEGGEKGGVFAYAIDRDGMTYSDEDLNRIAPTTFEYAKRVIATVKHREFTSTKADIIRVIGEMGNLSQAEKAAWVEKAQAAEYFEAIFDAYEGALNANDAAAPEPTASPSDAPSASPEPSETNAPPTSAPSTSQSATPTAPPLAKTGATVMVPLAAALLSGVIGAGLLLVRGRRNGQ